MSKHYVIYAPKYNVLSAGVVALYRLCEELRAIGETAGVVEFGDNYRAHEDAIVVYPDIVIGNPLGAKHVIRWLLYYAGRYRGNATFDPSERVYGYTSLIAKHYGKDAGVLCLPVAESALFIPATEPLERSGACFYAHKYRTFYHGDESLLPSHAVEITNPGQSRDELVRLFQNSCVFFAFEDTQLMLEAVMCGCKVVCVPSPSFPECCLLEDFNAGIGWGEYPTNIDDADRQFQILRVRFKQQLRELVNHD